MYFTTKIEPADIYFSDEIPVSKQFDDVYYTREGVIDEINHVFIEGNRLKDRFSNLSEEQCFTIGEMGFGTGLNFLQTWKIWEDIQRKRTSHKAKLLFVSAELYPLRKADLVKALQPYESLARYANALLEIYPPLVGGYHLLELSPQVKLMLMLGDATEMWREFHGKIDAWFLDGFNPAKNESLWSSSVFEEVASHSKQTTTLSSFSVARIVKDQLITHGFSFTKSKGFGRKREMIMAGFDRESLPIPPTTPPKKVGIIGAGLSGLWLGAKLHERDMECIIWEQETPASRGSGNEIGLISPYLNKVNNPIAAFLMMSFIYTKQLLNNHPELATFEGIHQVAKNDVQRDRLLHIAQSGNYPQSFLQIKDGLSREFMLAEGGYAFPKKICQYLINNYQLSIREYERVARIEQYEQQWMVSSNQRTEVVDTLVFCNGEGILDFTEFASPSLSVSKGILFQLDKKDSHQLYFPTKFGKYICTAPELKFNYLGGVYKESEGSPEDMYQEWSKEIEEYLPHFFRRKQQNRFFDGYRLCDRINTSDRLPLVGHYFKTTKNNIVFYDNLLQSIGHGSRGIITAPLSAEVLACLIKGEPLPIPLSTLKAIACDRFWQRMHKSKFKS